MPAPAHGTTCRVKGTAVYESNVFGGVPPPTPGLPASRVQAPIAYVPAVSPTVFQVQVDVDEKACTTTHDPPGRRTRNSTSRLHPPGFVTVKVTTLPTVCGDGLSLDRTVVRHRKNKFGFCRI